MPFYGPPWYRARFPCVEGLPSVWLAVLGLVFVVQGGTGDAHSVRRSGYAPFLRHVGPRRFRRRRARNGEVPMTFSLKIPADRDASDIYVYRELIIIRREAHAFAHQGVQLPIQQATQPRELLHLYF